MVKLYKGSIFVVTETQFAIQRQVTKQATSTERLHVDATILRSYHVELFSHFLPSSYAGHANLAVTKHWLFMPKWKYGSTVEFMFKIYFVPKYRIQYYDYKYCKVVQWSI